MCKTKIFIKDIKAQSFVGIHDWEKKVENTLLISLEVTLRGRSLLKSDSISYTLDYNKLSEIVCNLAASRHFYLIETLAKEIVKEIKKYKFVKHCKAEVSKPNALKAGCGMVSVIYED